MGLNATIFVFWMLSFKLAFSLSSFMFIKRIFSFSLLSAIRVVSSVYLRLLIFLPAILIPAIALSSGEFCTIYSAYMLNKQGDNIQPGWNPLLILNQSIVLCPVLTTVSWPAYRFLWRQVRWSDSPISLRIFQFAVIHTVKGFSTVVLLILFVTPIALLFMLSALFAEPRVGKAWAKRLEEDSRGLRNCRHIYPLPADTAAITTYSVALLSWLTDGRSRDAAMMLPPCRWSPCIPTAQTSSRPSESLMARVGKTVSDLSCYITIIYKTWGETVFLANLLSPLTRQRSRSRCFAVIPLLFLWFNRCWHSDLWFSFFSDVHMEVLGSHTVEAEHEGFWTLPC